MTRAAGRESLPLGGSHRLSINLTGRLRTFGRFVGNGLDRSVLPCQKHDATRKPRAVRRDFIRCARPAVRRGQDTRPTLLPAKGLFPRNLPSTLFCLCLWHKLHLIYYLLSLIYYLYYLLSFNQIFSTFLYRGCCFARHFVLYCM